MGATHHFGGPGHAGAGDVLLFGLQHPQLLLLADLFSQAADLLHLLIVALLVRVVLPSALLQLLLLFQLLQFLSRGSTLCYTLC